ncbi:Ribonuclease BN, tRNA processing enzyme [Desulfonatronum thiosulfatophilum]|uniref:Ribonuclease BN, tRNA processing enzyme n=1 Tax=Desulfonatronum thiosulfatophilum TaxID=617002 RepID=A0A1G6EJ92_9BACT|nr:MBL fold metallo-hydrolase [Desulfonatronum thiosulfatophilum]SDB57424.1 Ribonuclease BN, tRNA processing enzyme [Desulfonatronum thiosulfatophilum]
MKVCFLGVGEAFDEHYPNASVLVSVNEKNRERHVLLDCGFTAPAAFYLHAPRGARPDVIWLSHFHGDHFLGLPLLLLRFHDEKRSNPLTIVGQAGVRDLVSAAFDLAYPGFKNKIEYTLEFVEVNQDTKMELSGFQWSFALNNHSAGAPCLSVRLDRMSASLVYSGDGQSTPQTHALAFRAGLLVHEAYGLEDNKPGHATVAQCIDFAIKAKVNQLALVHLNRMVREEHANRIRAMLHDVNQVKAFLPEPGVTMEIQ